MNAQADGPDTTPLAEAAGPPAWWRIAADRLPVGVALFDAQEFRLEWINNWHREFLAEAPPPRAGRRLCDLIPQAGAWGLEEIFRRVAQSGESHLELEWAWQHPQQTRYFRWWLHPLRDGGQRTTHLLAVVSDVTGAVESRRRAGKLAAQAAGERQWLEAVLRRITAAVVIAQAPAGRILMANLEGSQIFPGPLLPCVEACSGCRIRNADGVAFRPGECPVRACLLEGRLTVQQEVRWHGDAGRQRILRLAAAPIPDADGASGAAALSFWDITEEQLAQQKIRDLNQHLERRTAELAATNEQLQLHGQELARLSRRKSEFLASMSHELRTPLNSVIGFSELLAEESTGPLNERQERFVSHILHGARHLLALICDVLDLSKIEAGALELRLEDFAAAGTIAEVRASLEPLAEARRITIASEVSPQCQVWADRVRFRQMLYNLLSNAVKFTPEGGCVRITGRERESGVEFAVSDTGPGIPMEAQHAVFEAFQQIGSGRASRQGTGLGLTITRRLVEKHGGRIWMESEPGRGSRFSLWLPSRTIPEPAAVAAVRLPRRKHPLVLVVDDEPAVLELLERYLQPEGYQTATAASGEEALCKARELQPDVITLDVLMPGKNGWETLSALKARPETSGIPVIMGSVVDETEMGFALGAADCLTKPITKSILLNALSNYVPPPSNGMCRVLVVDDDEDSRMVIGGMLESAGYLAVPAAGGREALEAMAAEAVDAVILDLLMPEMNGFEVLWRIRGDPRTRDLPILVLTAKDLTPAESELLERHTEACFRKSDEWKRDLLAQLDKALRRPKEAAA